MEFWIFVALGELLIGSFHRWGGYGVAEIVAPYFDSAIFGEAVPCFYLIGGRCILFLLFASGLLSCLWWVFFVSSLLFLPLAVGFLALCRSLSLFVLGTPNLNPPFYLL